MVYKLIAIGGAVIVLTYAITKKARKQVKKVHLNELAEHYSDGCDKLILDELKKGFLNFISGRLIFAWDPSDSKIKVNSELYFQSSQGEWVRKSHEEKLPSIKLTASALADLKEKGTIMFEVHEPANI